MTATLVYSILLGAFIILSFVFYWMNLKLNRNLVELKNSNLALTEANKNLTEEYRKKLLISNLGVMEAERKKIGSDLHDFMGSMLWAAKVQLGLVARTGAPNASGIKAIEKANEILDETINNTRSVIQCLVPKTLITQGLSEAIQEHCDRISSDTMNVSFEERGEPFFRGSNDSKLILLFRIVQELLNNCVKYSGATSMHVYLNWGAQLIVTITNNGLPFELESCLNGKTNGVGTLTIMERVSLLKGTLTSEAGPLNSCLLEIPYK